MRVMLMRYLDAILRADRAIFSVRTPRSFGVVSALLLAASISNLADVAAKPADSPRAIAKSFAPVGATARTTVAVERQITDTLRNIWVKASSIHAASDLLTDADRSKHSPTLNAIHEMGPYNWTKQKVEQLLSLGGLDDAEFKSILVDYLSALTERAERIQRKEEVEKPSLVQGSSDLSAQYAEKLAGFPVPLKQQFLVLLRPVTQNTNRVFGEAAQADLAASGPSRDQQDGLAAAGNANPNALTGQAYFDDIDSLFEETKAKIDQNFSKFTNMDQQNQLANKLLEAPVREKDMRSSMKQTTNSAIQQFGQFKSGLQQLQTILDTPK